MRVLVLWVPDWPVVAAGCPPEAPAAVLRSGVVVAATPAARTMEVVPGLRRREAQARCPELVIVEADERRDARFWELAVSALEESVVPAVEVLAPGELALASRGPARYFGGEIALGRRVAQLVDAVACQSGLVVLHGSAVGVADGLFVARLAARVAAGRPAASASDRMVVVPPGGGRSWLAPLPVSALSLAASGPRKSRFIEDNGLAGLAELLVRLGVRTLGELAALPAPAVLARFGPLGQAGQCLARGGSGRRVMPRPPALDLEVAMELDPPAERAEQVAFCALTVAEELHSRLARYGLVCHLVAIEAETIYGEKLVRLWRHDGGLSARSLADRARWQIDGWLSDLAALGTLSGKASAPSGRASAPTGSAVATGGRQQQERRPIAGRPIAGRPIAGRAIAGQPIAGQPIAGQPIAILRMRAEEVGPSSGLQLALRLEDDGGDNAADRKIDQFARAIARVQGMLGPEAVMQAVPAGGRSPAELYRLVPVAASPHQRYPDTGRRGGEIRMREESPPWPGRLPGPAPAVVHPVALPAEVYDPLGRPVKVSGRGLLSGSPAAVSVAGRRQAVSAWGGPWPLEERWWSASGRRRARLQVVLEGGDAYLLSRERRHWWVEATYA